MRRGPGGVALALACACAAAQETETVVVTATRAPRSPLEIPASVDRIDRSEIREDRQEVNLSESLGAVRGIRLVADGIPATMPDGQGQAATFALGSADHIEVLRGPFSVLYGNSSGGVIAVETMDGPEVPTGEADLLLGSYRTWRGDLKFGGTWGGLNAIGDLSRFETDGYRQHSMTRRDHFNAKLKYGPL